jgi:hypothetical protein
MKNVSSLRRFCSGWRPAFIASLFLLALPAASRAAPSKSCDPFCGVLRFMAPPQHHATAAATRRTPRRTTRVATARRPLPRIIYAAAPPVPRVYARPYPRYVYYPVVYPAYGYPGYGYVTYYAVPVY